ncbi:MAG: hypothetical protein RIN56_18640 [Sporomusaceae bacterium]|nr:hypothetical protein [Sporomusaceae bacterium]
MRRQNGPTPTATSSAASGGIAVYDKLSGEDDAGSTGGREAK